MMTRDEWAHNGTLYHKQGQIWREENIDRWREEHPLAWDHWTTKHGYVLQLGGFRVYYGNCSGCGALITQRRNVQGYKGPGPTMVGRWKSTCPSCQEARQATAARGGMRKTRAKQAARKEADRQRREGLQAEREARRPEMQARRAAAERRRNGLPPKKTRP